MIRFILISILLLTGKGLLAQFGEHLLLSNDNVALQTKDFILRDLDGDGDLDVLNCSYLSQTVSWHENLGNGNFGPVQIINTLAHNGIQVEASDVDGDGDLDALVSDDTWIAWYENTGGQFSSNETIITAATGLFILFDFDNDGDEDLIIQPFGSFNGLQLAESNGDGTFVSPTTISSATESIGCLNKGDVDGDGDLDIVSVSRNPDGTNRNVCWVENQNPGWTTHIISTASTIEEGEIVVSDANLDGRNDIICASANNSNLTVYYNNGASFSGGTILDNTVTNYYDLRNADLNGDGVDDLVAGAYTSGLGSNSIFINNGSGYNSSNLPFENYNATDMELGDIDGDGDVDIVCSNEFDEIAWIENDGMANFVEEHYIAISAYAVTDVACVDVGNNGLKDIVFTTSNSNRLLYLQNDFGSFNQKKKIEHWGGQQVLSGDFNNDGLQDLTAFTGANPEIRWYLQQAVGSFGPSSTIFGGGSFPDYKMSDTFDCNNDGLLDFCYVKNNTVYRALNDGGSWTIGSSLTGNIYSSVFPSDMDDDGLTDLVVSYTLSHRVDWIQNQGGGNFGSPQTLANSIANVKNTIVADFDGDGIKDLLTSSNSAISFSQGLGGLSFATPISLTSGVGLSQVSDLETADMDDDGDQDIIAADYGSGKLIWIENLSNNSFGTVQIISSDYSGANEILIEDIDLDNDMDIVISSESDGKIAWFENYHYRPNQARGSLFIDLDQNGVQDSTDIPMPFTEVISTPSYSFAYSYEDGRYFMNFEDNVYNSYVIQPEFLQDWGITTDSLTYTVNVDSAFVFMDSLDFGMYPTNISDSIDVELTGAFPTCNEIVNYWIDVNNTGTTLPSGIIQLTLDDSISYVGSAITPDSIIGQNLYWSYDSLSFFDFTQIDLDVQMPTFINMGNNLQSILKVTVDSLSGSVYTAVDTLNQILVCAYDPNDKVADPAGLEPDGMGYISPSTDYIDYTIRFQNTGNAPASNVSITDQLDSSLEWSSLEVLAYSDPHIVDVNPNGLIEFTFENINLPDSSADFLGSQGFIKYRIKLKENLPIPTIIQNEANIYFDYNPPILTNTETNTLFECQDIMNDIAFTQNACQNSQVQMSIPGDSTPTNYTWQISGVVSQTGDTFDWIADTSGELDLYLSIDNPMCFIDTTVQLNITSASPPTSLPVVEVCYGDSAFIFNNYESASDLYYDTLIDINGCDSLIIQELVVIPEVSIDFNNPGTDTLCLTESPVTLSATPTGGTFNGSGVSGGVFDPEDAGVGTQTITYNYVDGNGCLSSETMNIVVNNCLGLSSVPFQDFKLYPNPVQEQLTLEISSNLIGERYSIQDVTGKVLISGTLKSKKSIIDMQNLARGVYFITLKQSGYAKRIVKK